MHPRTGSCNDPASLERYPSRSVRLLSRWKWGIGAACLLASGAACRIYREAPSREDPLLGGSAGQPATSGGATGERAATRATGPAADALNLWVLNRPEADLPVAEQPAPVKATPPEPRRAPVAAAVVLGVGPVPACADQLARSAVEALSTARAPLEVLTSALDRARRWRWPDDANTSSATLKSSTGAFGGVEAAPASAFGVPLLQHVLERRVVLGGPGSRRVAGSGPGWELAACEGSAAPGLSGPVGVLLRDANGDFAGGVVHVDPLADAGVVSIAAQYGVSLAVGTAGAVLMAADCEPPPLERVAERVYASANWVLATSELQAQGACRFGHALLGADRAWLAPPSALAARIAEAALPESRPAPATVTTIEPLAPAVPAPAAPAPPSAPGVADAGSDAPPVTP